ncbi:hypothetical protein P7K49_018382, partial [Saguinus oedipus]
MATCGWPSHSTTLASSAEQQSWPSTVRAAARPLFPQQVLDHSKSRRTDRHISRHNDETLSPELLKVSPRKGDGCRK